MKLWGGFSLKTAKGFQHLKLQACGKIHIRSPEVRPAGTELLTVCQGGKRAGKQESAQTQVHPVGAGPHLSLTHGFPLGSLI